MTGKKTKDWADRLGDVRAEMAKGVVGQAGMIDGLLTCLACGGHALLESVPGLAKTRAVALLAQVSGLPFKRLQFTPDLLPADIVGTRIYNPATTGFEVRKGPIFSNFVLADEVNRAPAKVQSALLECMQERQVTLGDETHRLPSPFFVFATMNPVEQEGTYPLPEAQVDRFLMKLVLDYPTVDEEVQVVNMVIEETAFPKIQGLLAGEDILDLQAAVRGIHLEAKLIRYIAQLVDATRGRDNAPAALKGRIALGASPRASIALAQTARAYALMQGRDHVEPGDIKAVAMPVLRHRILPNYQAEAEGIRSTQLVTALLAAQPVP